MTENKLIIDEIDVSKCKDFHYGECLNPAETVSACENCPSCLFKQLARKTQECQRLKRYLKEIRNQELFDLDIDWDEYETQCTSTEYSNIINLVEEALGERSPEDCRYDG